MKELILFLISAHVLSCGSSHKLHQTCDQTEIEQKIHFEGISNLSGTLYFIEQRISPGLGQVAGESGYITPYVVHSFTDMLSIKDFSIRPFMLSEEIIVVVNEWIILHFVDNVSSAEIMKKISSVSDGIIDFQIALELRHDRDEEINSKVRLRRILLENEKALIFSVHRCTLKHKLFRGINVLWSDQDFVKIAILMHPDSKMIDELLNNVK